MRTFRSIATRSLAALAVSALAIGLAACSGDEPDPKGTGSQGAQAGTQSGDTDDPYASWIAAIGDAKTYSFTIELRGEQGEMTGSVDRRDADDLRFSYEMTRDDETMKAIVVGGKLYGNAGEVTGNKYFARDLPKESDEGAKAFAEVEKVVDLTTQLTANRDAVLSVEKKGDPVSIDGVFAQRYEVTLDASKLSDDDPRTAFDGDSTATSPEPATEVYTYYIGPDDLPRRIVFKSGDTTLTMNCTDWGEKMRVEAPPASQITEVDPYSEDESAE